MMCFNVIDLMIVDKCMELVLIIKLYDQNLKLNMKQ